MYIVEIAEYHSQDLTPIAVFDFKKWAIDELKKLGFKFQKATNCYLNDKKGIYAMITEIESMPNMVIIGNIHQNPEKIISQKEKK